MKPDAEYRTVGGWKVHLTIGRDRYEERAEAVCRWLSRNVEGTYGVDWKHLDGGTKHEKDFTIHLGSYATMTAFVTMLEQDPIVQQLDRFNGGTEDRCVGDSRKVGARFAPTDKGTGSNWAYGWNGIPFAVPEDARQIFSRNCSRQEAADRPRAFLKAMFGDYFLPAGIE